MQHYSTNWQAKVTEGWQQALEDEAYNVTGTLKFNNGRTIGRTTAHQILNAYWHKLDRTFFGHAADKGTGIDRWIFSEYGKTGDNLHFHFKAKAPIEPYYFCCIANVLWSRFHHHTARGIYNWITPTLLTVKSARYTVKETRHFTYDVMGLAASHQNKQGTEIEAFQNASQAHRILNKLTLIDIEQAQQIVDWHIEETIKGIYQRQRRAEVRGTQQA